MTVINQFVFVLKMECFCEVGSLLMNLMLQELIWAMDCYFRASIVSSPMASI
jgi:hypothetical protein